MGEKTKNPLIPTHSSVSAVQTETKPSSIPPDLWARLQADAGELKAQDFQTREQVLAWLQTRGYEDGANILQRLKAGGEI